MGTRVSVACALALLLAAAPAIRAAGDCTVTLDGTDAIIVCTGDVPEKLKDGRDWPTVLADLTSATTADVQFNAVEFTGFSFQRMLDIVFGVGGNATGTVVVGLKRCTMSGAEFDAAAIAELAGSRQYVFTLSSCAFDANRINMTGGVLAETNIDVSVSLLSTALLDNVVIAAGAVGVGATGRGSLQVAERSIISGNELLLVGALAVGGEGALTTQLSTANISANSLTDIGLVALGGSGTAQVTGQDDPSVTLIANTRTSDALVVTDQPVVTGVMNILTGLAFEQPGFDLAASLTGAQGQLCSALSGTQLSSLNATGLPTEAAAQLQPLLDQVLARLCTGGNASASFDLGQLAPTVQALLTDGAAGLAGVLDSLLAPVLGSEDLLEDLVGGFLNGTLNSTALDSLLAGLLTSPAGDAAAGLISDVLSQLSEWLGTPFGGGGNGTNSTDTGSTGGTDGAGDTDSIGGLGNIINDIIAGVSGVTNGAGESQEDGADVAGSVGAIVEDLVNDLVGAIDGAVGGGGDGTTPGDILNDLLGVLTAGEGGPLAGVDLTGILPVFGAVLDDPAARGELPGIISSLVNGGDASSLNLGPVISAVLGNQDAAAALPDLLTLAQNLGLSFKRRRA